MSQRSSSTVLNSLFVTPLTVNEEIRVQDMLGWMGEKRGLQHEFFPTFTVLTNYRWHAELLLFLVGLAEEYVSDDNKAKHSVNHFFRDFELFWALSQLTKKDGSIEGLLNIRRFEEYLSQNEDHFRIASNSSASYLQNLGYGVAPHYWISLREWGLIEKDRGEFPRLTPKGRELYKLLRPFEKQSNQREMLNRWFSGGAVSRSEFVANTKKYTPKTDTAWSWYALAVEKAKTERIFGILWLMLSGYIRPDHVLDFRALLYEFESTDYPLALESSRQFNYGDLLRRWVIKELSYAEIPDQDKALLNDVLKRCRQAEVLGGIADFLMIAMVEYTKDIEEPTIEKMVASWASWLPAVKELFLSFYGTTSIDSAFRRAFPKLRKNTSSELFLRSILDRHLQVKGSQALIHEGNGYLERTEAVPPNIDPNPLLQRLNSRDFDLPTEALSDNPDDPWRVFTDYDLNWNRFARWMGIADPAEPADEADSGLEGA